MHGCDEDEPYPCCGAKSGHMDWCHLNAETDDITKLCALVREAGGTMQLYGKPVDSAGLKARLQPIVDAKLEILRIRQERESEEKRWVEVWADVERVTKP